MRDYKEDFPLLQGRDITYLDSAATSQKPQMVLDRIEGFYSKYNANPHRGVYTLSIEATNEYDNARQKVADFIGARRAEEVIFTKNATEAANIVAYSYGFNELKEGDEVVVSIMEHHSCIVPWQSICKKTGAILKYMYMNYDYQITSEEVVSKITSKTKVVCITHVSNVLGTINDIEFITEYSHKMGAKVLVDASQSIQHVKLDVTRLDADFLIFSGHKMLAPLGIGVLYGKYDVLDKMEPFLMGGDMIEYVYEQETEYAQLPNKFEAGTQNVEGAVGLASAIDYIEAIGYDEIQRIDDELLEYARDELDKLEYVTCYMTSDVKRHSALISFNVNGVHPHDVSDILNSVGVCVRAGNHCAHPLLRSMGLESTNRASFYVYNTRKDVDNLILGLEKVYSIFSKYIK